jgi:hypothetical protein
MSCSSSDESLQSELFKVIRKIMEKVTDAWIVAVAVNHLVLEMVFVMP